MALIKDKALIEDPFVDVSGSDEIPDAGAIIVSLTQWLEHSELLGRRADPVGVRLRSDEQPETIAEDLDSLAVVALEFPAFKDGRAYSYARLLRDKYGYTGEIRAVGDVLLEQLHFMERTGFNAFEIHSDDPLGDLAVAAADFDVWYQPAADDRRTVVELRHGLRAG